MYCHYCAFEIHLKRKPGREELCPNCSNYIHCCFNCIFYKETASHQCREVEADWVEDKAFGNYCDYFKPSEDQKPRKDSKADDARNKLDQLFKK